MTQDMSSSASAFTGQWIGETQGCTMPAHLWEISQQGDYLFLMTRWEGESTYMHFYAQMVPGEAAFRLSGDREYKATLVDRQHFVIPDWCTGTDEGWDGKSQTYDVVFSRPGIAELTGRAAYLKSLEKTTALDDQSTNSSTSPNGK